MQTSKFEKLLPWSGAFAGLLWAVQSFISTLPDKVQVPRDLVAIDHDYGRNVAAGLALIVASFALVLFATAARSAQRAGEATESTYSSVAHAGFVVAASGFGLLGLLQIAASNAVHDGNLGASAALLELVKVGWLPALAGVVAALFGTGLGGLRNRTVPKWFAVVTVVLAVIGVMGPLAFVVYLALPVWLVTAAVVLVTSSKSMNAVPAH